MKGDRTLSFLYTFLYISKGLMMMCNPVYLHNTVTVKDPFEYPRQLQWICRNIII